MRDTWYGLISVDRGVADVEERRRLVFQQDRSSVG